MNLEIFMWIPIVALKRGLVWAYYFNICVLRKQSVIHHCVTIFRRTILLMFIHTFYFLFHCSWFSWMIKTKQYYLRREFKETFSCTKSRVQAIYDFIIWKKIFNSNTRFYLVKHHSTPLSMHYTKRLWMVCISIMSSDFFFIIEEHLRKKYAMCTIINISSVFIIFSRIMKYIPSIFCYSENIFSIFIEKKIP